MLMTFGQDAVTVRQDLSTFLAVKAGSEYILTTAIIRMYITYAGVLCKNKELYRILRADFVKVAG
jgi:hypothetical protein